MKLKGKGLPEDHRKTDASNINQALGNFEIKTKRRKVADRKKSIQLPPNNEDTIPEKTKYQKLRALAKN
jgi:hypothetical protein